jgi:hypothetical protein
MSGSRCVGWLGVINKPSLNKGGILGTLLCKVRLEQQPSVKAAEFTQLSNTSCTHDRESPPDKAENMELSTP